MDQEEKNHCALVCIQLHRERAYHQPIAAFHVTTIPVEQEVVQAGQRSSCIFPLVQ